jgi:hypothetical protein
VPNISVKSYSHEIGGALRQTYSWIALAVGSLLSAVLLLYSTASPGNQHSLPLLTSLLLCEVGFIATAIGVGLGVRQIMRQRRFSMQAWAIMVGNLVLAVNFARIAVVLWPETGIA